MKENNETYSTDLTVHYYPFGDQVKGSSKVFKASVLSFSECFSMMIVYSEADNEEHYIPLSSVKDVKVKYNKVVPRLQVVKKD